MEKLYLIFPHFNILVLYTILIENTIPYKEKHPAQPVAVPGRKTVFQPQNSGNNNSLPTFKVSRINTTATAGRTIRLPFLMASPAPI